MHVARSLRRDHILARPAEPSWTAWRTAATLGTSASVTATRHGTPAPARRLASRCGDAVALGAAARAGRGLRWRRASAELADAGVRRGGRAARGLGRERAGCLGG